MCLDEEMNTQHNHYWNKKMQYLCRTTVQSCHHHVLVHPMSIQTCMTFLLLQSTKTFVSH